MFFYDKGKTMQEGFLMDATKIGAFIAAERRAKGWTQRQLADKLQLTDKAVSRWETGKGLPDVSFLLPFTRTV